MDGNGCLDYEEWLAATAAARLLERDDLLHRTFQDMDKASLRRRSASPTLRAARCGAAPCVRSACRSRARLRPAAHPPPQLSSLCACEQDGNGTLSADEVADALGANLSIGQDEAQSLIAAADTNGDGVIDWPEFLAMLRAGQEGEEVESATALLRRRSIM